MIIQYCSDLHLEFPENEAWLKAHPIVPTGQVLILAGDVVPFKVMDRYSYFFDWLADSFEAVYWLPGNHEYYGSDILQRSGSFKETIRSNMLLLNNATAMHGDVTLIFSTLWTGISPAAEWDIAQGLADYKYIRYGQGRFRPLHSARLHEDSFDFLEGAVANAKGKTIVATHHVPTFMHYPEQYRGSALSEAFATELYPFIDGSGIDAWIYGHHHANTPDFNIGTTQMRTAQLGYVSQNEHFTFNGGGTIYWP